MQCRAAFFTEVQEQEDFDAATGGFGAFFEVGSYLDWLSPLLTVGRNVITGPTTTFLLPRDSYWSFTQIHFLLSDYGIRSWNRMLAFGTYMVTVSRDDADLAHFLFCKHSVPFISRFEAKYNYGVVAGQARAWEKVTHWWTGFLPMVLRPRPESGERRERHSSGKRQPATKRVGPLQMLWQELGGK